MVLHGTPPSLSLMSGDLADHMATRVEGPIQPEVTCPFFLARVPLEQR